MIVPVIKIAGGSGRGEDLTGHEVQIRSQPADVFDRRVQFPTQPHADSQFRSYLPIVGDEAVQTPAEQPGELLAGTDSGQRGDRLLNLIGPVQQEVRKRGAGLAAGESEGPLHEREGLPAHQDVLKVDAQLHRMAAMGERERVGHPSVFIPNRVGCHATEGGEAGDVDGGNAGREHIVGQSWNEQILRNIKIRAADVIERRVEVAIIGDCGKLVQLRRRDHAGIGENRVLLTLGLVPAGRLDLD